MILMRNLHIIRLILIASWLSGHALAYMDIKIDKDAANALGVELTGGVFSVAENSLTFGRADLEYFSGGNIEAGHFIATAIPWTQDLELLDQKTGRKYRIQNAHIGEAGGQLHILNADIVANSETVSSGILSNVGTLVVGELFTVSPWSYTPVPAPAGDLPFCTTNYGPAIDVQLTALNSMQQTARSNGLVALSMSTKLVNVGTHDVPWFWAIHPPGSIQPITGQHPYAVFNLYQLRNGIFRQIGKSDAKHAFYSTNTDCDCPGAQVIFSGCADTYSFNNNANQFYFGPRSEVHAFSGQWDSLGSHFDVTATEPIPNNVRSHYSETNEFAHRLVVDESSLTMTDAHYFVESWYLVQGDTNEYNSMGFRRVTPILSTGVWTFITQTTLTNGPAIDAFVPRNGLTEYQSHQVLDTGEGIIHVAVNVTPIGSSMFRYGYAVMNLNFDRQIQSFSIPISPGAILTNLTFSDTDSITSNDWVAGNLDGWIKWTMAETNSLSWGTLFSFSVDTDVPPTPSQSGLSSLESGPTNSFIVPTLAPGIQISNLKIGEEDTHINLSSVTGAVYDLEYNDSVSGIGWIPLGLSVTAATPSVVIIDTNSPSNQLFYRLKLLSTP